MAKKIIKSAEATPEQRNTLKDNLQKAKSIKRVVKPVSKKKVVKRKPKAKPVVKSYDQDFEYICLEVERGTALRVACVSFMSTRKFYELLDESKERQKRYARACEERAGKIFDDILTIADESNADVSLYEGKIRIDGEAIQRSKLKIEARKWVLSKLEPKKYGDKIDVDHTTNGESINPTPILFSKGSKSE